MMLKHRLPCLRLATRMVYKWIISCIIRTRGEHSLEFWGNWFISTKKGTNAYFEGNWETQTIDEHGKRDSLIWRNMGTRQLISCKKETSNPDGPH